MKNILKIILIISLSPLILFGNNFTNKSYNPYAGKISNHLHFNDTEHYDGQTIEECLGRKNKHFVKMVLGDPDKKRRKFRKVYYIYNNSAVSFKNLKKSTGELVIVFRNGMVSDIKYNNQRY